MSTYTEVKLNDAGKKEFKGIFPKDTIPILSVSPSMALLGIMPGEHSVYKVDWAKLTKPQQDKIVKYAAKMQNGKPEEVRGYFDKLGYVPLQAKWVDFAVTSSVQLF